MNRFCDGNPASFCIGDIVEAQVSFVIVPIQATKFTLKPVLRALTLMDSTQSKVRLLEYITFSDILKPKFGTASDNVSQTISSPTNCSQDRAQEKGGVCR